MQCDQTAETVKTPPPPPRRVWSSVLTSRHSCVDVFSADHPSQVRAEHQARWTLTTLQQTQSTINTQPGVLQCTALSTATHHLEYCNASPRALQCTASRTAMHCLEHCNAPPRVLQCTASSTATHRLEYCNALPRALQCTASSTATHRLEYCNAPPRALQCTALSTATHRRVLQSTASSTATHRLAMVGSYDWLTDVPLDKIGNIFRHWTVRCGWLFTVYLLFLKLFYPVIWPQECR